MKKILIPSAIFMAAAAAMTAPAWAQSMRETQGEPGKSTLNSEMPQPVTSPEVLVETSLGNIKIRLYDDTPLHRDNFLKLAKEGYYDGVLFHRVIKDFMVQTGDPNSRNAGPDEMLGAGDPNYTLEAEILYPHHYHKYGALAAARTGDQVNPERRSSGSQFYIVTGRKVSPAQMQQLEDRIANAGRQDYFRQLCKEHFQEIDSLRKAGKSEELEKLRQSLIEKTERDVEVQRLPENIKEDYINIGGTPHLDGQYTVFGEVVEGMETVEKIQNVETGNADRPVEDVKILKITVL